LRRQIERSWVQPRIADCADCHARVQIVSDAETFFRRSSSMLNNGTGRVQQGAVARSANDIDWIDKET
jgi:hypothetical protein